jgi:hypothetical protein
VSKGRSPSAKPGRELLLSVRLSDCEVQAFQAGGPGGQHQNHSNTGIRIIHKASGARGESREERSQLLNKKAAFRRMTEHGLFRAWVNRQIFYHGESPEKRVQRDLAPANLRTEIRGSSGWEEITGRELTAIGG